MKYFRKFLALMGLAVAPDKCEFVEYGGTLEVLGILFTVHADKVATQLPEAKAEQIIGRIGTILDALRDLHSREHAGQPVEMGGLKSRPEEELEEAHAVTHSDNVAAVYGIVKGALKCNASTGIVFQRLGWLTEEQLEKKPMEKAAKRPNNHCNGISARAKLEKWAEAEKKATKRPKAPNIVPHACRKMWPMNAYFVPHEVDTPEKCELLRQGHPRIQWAMLQLFRHFLYERGTTAPKTYVALVAQRMRSLCCLERGNVQSAQLQTLTLDNLDRFKTKFTPDKAAPPDLAQIEEPTTREQAIFGMWTCTGLRKDSFCSIRTDMTQLVFPACKYVRAVVPCVKSIPTPGKVFRVYIPADVFFPEAFPVEPEECDRISLKLRTTSHGIRRALALYLRRLAGEIGLMPYEDMSESKSYAKFKGKVSQFFGWSDSSSQWIMEYSKDVVLHLGATFWVRPLVEEWLLSDL
eukprot:g1422.t1